MANYPSVITGFTNPLATQRLNAPSHSGIETAQNTDLTAIETFLGTEGNTSTIGTLIYDVRSAGSNGGGHVQATNVGGTGQTSYNKGDLLIASSSSVLTRLAVASDGMILQTNSSVATGINWVTSPTNKIAVSALTSVLSGAQRLLETSVFSVSIPASVMGTNNALRARVFVNEFLFPNSSVLLKANYGSNNIASMLVTNDNFTGASGFERRGYIEINLSNTNASIQTGNLMLNVAVPYQPRSSVLSMVQPGASSINSASANNLGLTIQFSSVVGGDNATFNTNGYTVEKIA